MEAGGWNEVVRSGITNCGLTELYTAATLDLYKQIMYGLGPCYESIYVRDSPD